jgi:hypothetical protein
MGENSDSFDILYIPQTLDIIQGKLSGTTTRQNRFNEIGNETSLSSLDIRYRKKVPAFLMQLLSYDPALKYFTYYVIILCTGIIEREIYSQGSNLTNEFIG